MRKQLLMIIGFIIALLLFTTAETDYNTLKADEWDTNNLNQAGDLKTYQNAWEAIHQKHELEVDLTNGATYNDGKLTNDGVTLDLTAPGLSGAKIVALSGGGFSISKGTAGNFEYDGNTIDFGSSTGSVEVKSNGEIVLPKGATMTDTNGNKITAIRDGLLVKKEGSITKLAGVGKVEAIPLQIVKEIDDGSDFKSTIEVISRVGYVGVGDSLGEVTFNPNQELQFAGKNYVQSVSNSISGEDADDISHTTTVVIDKEMHQNLKSIVGGDVAKLKTYPAIAAELKPHFDSATAQELAWKLYTEYNPSTALNGHRGLLSLSRASTGTAFIPRFMGSLTKPVEGNKMKIPLLSPESSSGAVAGYYTNTPYGKGVGPAFAMGTGEIVAVTTGLSPDPAVTYERNFGGKVIAKVTVHPGLEETSAWVSIGVPALE
ncbi:hypothetical protein HZC30_06205 [Candidatus Woesearchaeota archaeon]|nr:hypothetical protein [Candidatus Woesearchaeota archaeon]